MRPSSPSLGSIAGLLQLAAGAVLMLLGMVIALEVAAGLIDLLAGQPHRPVAGQLPSDPPCVVESAAAGCLAGDSIMTGEPKNLLDQPLELLVVFLCYLFGKSFLLEGLKRFNKPFEPTFDIHIPMDADSRLREISDRQVGGDR